MFPNCYSYVQIFLICVLLIVYNACTHLILIEMGLFFIYSLFVGITALFHALLPLYDGGLTSKTLLLACWHCFFIIDIGYTHISGLKHTLTSSGCWDWLSRFVFCRGAVVDWASEVLNSGLFLQETVVPFTMIDCCYSFLSSLDSASRNLFPKEWSCPCIEEGLWANANMLPCEKFLAYYCPSISNMVPLKATFSKVSVLPLNLPALAAIEMCISITICLSSIQLGWQHK